VNALATNGTDHASLLAAMMLPPTTAHAAAPAPAFVNMISLFLSTPNQGTSLQDGQATAATTTTSPAQIADAMIRSILGITTISGSAMLGGSTPGNAVNTPATTPTGTANQSSSAPAPEMTSAIDFALTDVVTPLPVNKVAPAGGNTDQTAKKQLPGTTGTPLITTLVVAPAPEPAASTMGMAARDSKPDLAAQNNPQGWTSLVPGASASLTKSSPESKVAFTAILTPTNQTTGTSSAPEQAASVTAASSNGVSQTPSVENLTSQTAIQGPAENTGGDSSSQQKDDSGETSGQAIAATAESKNKVAAGKQDDDDPQAIVSAVGDTVQDHSFAVASPAELARAASVPSDGIAVPATPSQTAAEALRTSESDLPAAPPTHAGAAQEITIRIEQPNASPVDLRVVERSGQVHVDVRTPDAAMQTSLRQDLGTLTNSLQRAGYHAETFTPSSTAGRPAVSTQTGNQDEHRESSPNRGGSGDPSGGRRQQQQQKRSSTWLEELEEQQ
jgi:hypothetical protein